MSVQLWNNTKNEFLSFSFNQDFTCFAAGTQTGFRVFNTEPFREATRRETFLDVIEEDKISVVPTSKSGGIGIIEMLYMCNLVALVGGGSDPRWPMNKVMIWDDKEECCIAELTFKDAVRSVRLRRDVIIVSTDTHVYLYNLHNLELFDHIETVSNKIGLLATSMDPHQLILACPGTSKGKVCVALYRSDSPSPTAKVSRENMTLVPAHESSLAAMTLSPDGLTLATASEKGTLVRTFDARTGRQIQELRRGADKAIIYSLVYDRTGTWLAAASDKATLHVWSTKRSMAALAAQEEGTVETPNVSNTKSKLAFMSAVLPSYFGSSWSCAHAKLGRKQGLKTVAAFTSDSSAVLAVSQDGSVDKFSLKEFANDKGLMVKLHGASIVDN